MRQLVMGRRYKICALLFIITVLSSYLTSCSGNENNTAENRTGTGLDSTVEELEEIKTASVITSDDFYKAVVQIDENNSFLDRLKQELGRPENPVHRQMNIIGQINYNIAWVNLGGNIGFLAVFKVDNNIKTPVYLKQFSRIETVGLKENPGIESNHLLEVITYWGHGSFSGQKVNLIALNSDTAENSYAKEVWSSELINTYPIHGISANEMEIVEEYSSYVLIPAFQHNFNSKYPVILANRSTVSIRFGTEDIERLDEIIASGEVNRIVNSKEQLYLWDPEAFKFVESPLK